MQISHSRTPMLNRSTFSVQRAPMMISGAIPAQEGRWRAKQPAAGSAQQHIFWAYGSPRLLIPMLS